jgi:hypothetical protein
MTQTTDVLPPLEVTPDARAFAQQQGVATALPAVLDLTLRVFPTARRFAVVAEDDPEIANDRHIIVDVYAPTTVPEALAAHRRWNEGLFALCPASHNCVFRLNLHQGD